MRVRAVLWCRKKCFRCSTLKLLPLKNRGLRHLLWRLRVIQAVPQLELVGLAAVQRGETWQQVDKLAAWRRRRSRGLHFVPPAHGRSARRGHGVDHQGSPRRRVAKMPLARRRRQGTVTRVQSWEKPHGGVVDGQSVGI